MNQTIKLTAFILLIIGTIGLLVNEFAADWGRVPTLIFAIFNCYCDYHCFGFLWM